MENTVNYNLKKPGQDDFYNVADFNSNADIIDGALKTHDTQLAQIATTELLGRVKVDGDTITSKSDGTISSTTKMKVLNATRDLSLSGTQIISSIGFKPKKIIMKLASLNTTAESFGVYDGTLISVMFRRLNNTVSQANNYIGMISNLEANTIQSRCAVGTVSDDSFELIWDKVGNPTGTGILLLIVFG